MPVAAMQSGKRRVYLIQAPDPRPGTGNEKFGHTLYAYALIEDGRLRIYPSHSEASPKGQLEQLMHGSRVITPLTRNEWLDPLYRAAFVAEILDVVVHGGMGNWEEIQDSIVSPDQLAVTARREEMEIQRALGELEGALPGGRFVQDAAPMETRVESEVDHAG